MSNRIYLLCTRVHLFPRRALSLRLALLLSAFTILGGCVETVSLVDSGPPGIDGGAVSDSGTVGIEDSGTEDSGSADDAGSGSIDGGAEALDAGPPDAGAPDAGPDAGPLSPCPPCTGLTPHCETASTQCVACLNDEHCEGGACDPDTGSCVECTSDAHCGGGTPACDRSVNECVGCLNTGHCGGETPYCDTDAQVCRQCLLDSDCQDAGAARCNAGTCTGCNSSPQCSGISGTEVCEVSSATCVQCTASEHSACGSTTCRFDNSCSDFGADRGLCESCDDDSNCAGSDNYCVPMRGARRGNFCLSSRTSTCRDEMSVLLAYTTVSGVGELTYCSVSNETSCEAVLSHVANSVCTTDAECGPGALCRTVDGQANRCTYYCTEPGDCGPLWDRCPDGPSPCPTLDNCAGGRFSGGVGSSWIHGYCGSP